MTPNPTRTRLPVDERREQLLRLGLELFSERPYDAVSIEEIAERASVSRGLLYHYFPGKREFYVAVVRAAVDELLDLVEPDPADDRAEQLRTGLRNFFAYARRRRHGFLTARTGGVGSDAEVQELTDAFRDRVVDLVLDATQLAASPRVLVALHGWVGYVESLVPTWLAHEDHEDAVTVDDLVELATHMLAATLARFGAGIEE